MRRKQIVRDQFQINGQDISHQGNIQKLILQQFPFVLFHTIRRGGEEKREEDVKAVVGNSGVHIQRRVVSQNFRKDVKEFALVGKQVVVFTVLRIEREVGKKVTEKRAGEREDAFLGGLRSEKLLEK